MFEKYPHWHLNFRSLAPNENRTSLAVLRGSIAKWGEINVCSDTNYKMEGAQLGAVKAFMTNIDIVPDDVKVDDSATFVWEIL